MTQSYLPDSVWLQTFRTEYRAAQFLYRAPSARFLKMSFQPLVFFKSYKTLGSSRLFAEHLISYISTRNVRETYMRESDMALGRSNSENGSEEGWFNHCWRISSITSLLFDRAELAQMYISV